MHDRDAGVDSTLAHMMDLTADGTAARLCLLRAGLSTIFDGIAVDSLVRESHEQHLGALYVLAGSLTERMHKMPGSLAPKLVAQLGSLESSLSTAHLAGLTFENKRNINLAIRFF